MRKLGLSFLVVAMACGGGGGSGDSWPSASSISDQSFTGALGDGSVLTVYVGTAVAAGNLVAPATPTLPVTGTLTYSGGSTALTGTYDPATGALLIETGGYSFEGTYSGGSIVGTVTTPTDDTFGFVLAIGDESTVTVYCGDWANTTSPTVKSGAFMLMISGGHAWGVAGTPDGPATFSGSASATHISMTIKANGRSISGTISGADVSGTFQTGSGGTGTWAGSSTSCPSGVPL